MKVIVHHLSGTDTHENITKIRLGGEYGDKSLILYRKKGISVTYNAKEWKKAIEIEDNEN